MTNHLDNHAHAFLDESNIVIEILVFDGHNSDLLNQVKEHLKAADVKCCCDNGIAYKNGDFFNGKFYPPKPYAEWIRDESIGSWVAPEGWVPPIGDMIN